MVMGRNVAAFVSLRYGVLSVFLSFSTSRHHEPPHFSVLKRKCALDGGGRKSRFLVVRLGE